ncbi:MAG: type IV toxin-antitoxin system AbiEi family antitoxin [Desulfobacteraceae bacterium]|jgi:hypothetical protein
MKPKVQGQEILREALEAFEKTTGLAVELYPVLEANVLDKETPDAHIGIKLNEMDLHFFVEIKATLTNATIGPIRQLLKRKDGKNIIVTKYVTPQLADKLKGQNIPFIDTAGNTFIKEPDLFLFIKGNRTVIPREKIKTRAFQPAGLQVIFTLLCNPKLEDENYRKIAKVATVALGTVGWVIQDLKKMGFLIDMGRRGRRLINKEKLLTKWVMTYPEQLRPKQLIGKYNAIEPGFWKNQDLPGEAFWGGEVAAAKLNKYLKPEIVTIYTNDEAALNKYVIKNRIQKNPEGKIEILKTFWKKEQQRPYPELVHPILIYTDLQATGDARNIETAEIIYEQELAGFIRED